MLGGKRKKPQLHLKPWENFRALIKPAFLINPYLGNKKAPPLQAGLF
jgi:hypothetical protein